MIDSFVLKWYATADKGLHAWHIPSNSTFSRNIMTSLCFLGALPATLEVLLLGPMGLFEVDHAALNMMKNT